MSSCSQSIKCKYDLESYTGTKSTYQLIINALEKLSISANEIKFQILFRMGDITHRCDSFDEFTNLAYGQDNYRLISLDMFYSKTNNFSIHISVSKYDDIYVSTNDKVTLEKVIDTLLLTADETSSENAKNQVQNHYYIGSVKGNGNSIVQGNNSNIDVSKEKKSESIFKGIFQGVIANWIYVIIGLIITAILAYFGIHK